MTYLAKDGESSSVFTRMMFDYEWELLKSKFIASQDSLIDANDAAHKQVLEEFETKMIEININLTKSIENIKKLKEYFT